LIEASNLNANRVCAPRLVDRDGTVYQTFNVSAWIFHLRLKGVKASTSRAASRSQRSSEFALLPTVDHLGDGLGPPEFRICGWLTNDCKADLTTDELLSFCRRILDHSSAQSAPPTIHSLPQSAESSTDLQRSLPPVRTIAGSSGDSTTFVSSEYTAGVA
jgi:hypothetical protein